MRSNLKSSLAIDTEFTQAPPFHSHASETACHHNNILSRLIDARREPNLYPKEENVLSVGTLPQDTSCTQDYSTLSESMELIVKGVWAEPCNPLHLIIIILSGGNGRFAKRLHH